MTRIKQIISGAILLAAGLTSQAAVVQLFNFTLDSDVQGYTGSGSAEFAARSKSSLPTTDAAQTFYSTNGVAPDSSAAQVVSGGVDGGLYLGAWYSEILIPGGGVTVPVDESAVGKPYTLTYQIWLPATNTTLNFARGMLWWQKAGGNFSAHVEQTTGNAINLAIRDAWQTITVTNIMPVTDTQSASIGSATISLQFGDTNYPPAGGVTNQLGVVYVRNVSLVADARRPFFSSVQSIGSDLSMTVTNGGTNTFFNLLASSNAAASVSSWVIAKRDIQFSSNGTASVSIPRTNTQRYFRVQETGAGGIVFKFDTGDGTWTGSPPDLSDWDGVHNHKATGGEYWFNSQNDQTVGPAYIQRVNGALTFYHAPPVADLPHAIQTAFTVKSASGANNRFTVVSFNWKNDSLSPGAAKLTGYLGGTTNGTVQWVVTGDGIVADPAITNGHPNVTTGNLSNAVDLIVFETVNPNYEDPVFGSAIDNLLISNPVQLFSPVVLWQDDDPSGPTSSLANGLQITPIASPVGNSATVGNVVHSSAAQFSNISTPTPVTITTNMIGRKAVFTFQYYVPVGTSATNTPGGLDLIYTQLNYNTTVNAASGNFITLNSQVGQGWKTVSWTNTIPAAAGGNPVTNAVPILIYVDGGFGGPVNQAPGTSMYLDNIKFRVE